MTGSTFLNRPNNSYLPLRDKPLTVKTKEIRGTGRQNKQEFYLLTKPWTIREKATVDLIYTTPQYVKDYFDDKNRLATFNRVTTTGETRITDLGLIRVTA